MTPTDPDATRSGRDAGPGAVAPADWAVLKETWRTVRDWVGALPPEAYDVASLLEGWTVGDLVAHLGRSIEVVTQTTPADAGVRPQSISTYVSAYPAAAHAIAEGTRQLARQTAGDRLGALDASWARALGGLDGLAAATPADRRPPQDRVVIAPRGPITVTDLVTTRVIELVVHADDLARAVPEVEAPAIPRAARRLVVRTLLDVLVERAPGRTVEVRVPPFAAVQCVEGPRHTRGTPPNVVETDATTWVRLACGRLTWAETVADGSVRASGERSDISALLPVV